MSGVNNVTLLGRLGKDPETKTLSNGNNITTFSIATSEKWKDKNSGEMQESTQWHNIVSYGKQGEVLAKYLKKGNQIYIEGKLKYSTSEKDGKKTYFTNIVVKSFSFIGDSKEPNKSVETIEATEKQPYRTEVFVDTDGEEIPF